MKTMFRKESPDDVGLTWMIEALRAARIRESNAFGDEERPAAPFLGRFQHASEERVTPNGKEINNHTKGNPGGRSEIIFWNVRGCSRTIERRISGTTTPLRGRFLNQPLRGLPEQLHY
uniref:Uncharacterized protein n=1 Tax=Vitis vinifera TaxID=29760 RepID=A5BRE6_VITVI|nr:hypothetical protein VITISV_019284 [Vitis vinifera]